MEKNVLLFLLILAPVFSLGQTSVVVWYFDGSSQSYEVSASDKLYFDSDNLKIHVSASGTPVSIPVGIIRKITFSGSLGIGTEPAVSPDTDWLIYPNPGEDVIRVQSKVPGNHFMRIFSATGQLVRQGLCTSNQEVNVSHLPAGLYLIQLDGNTLKFSKK